MGSFKFIIEYSPETGKKVIKAFVEALDQYHRQIYPEIISRAPMYKGSDPRRTSGNIKDSIKLMPRSFMGNTYMTPGVPGANVKGSPKSHIWAAILAFHYGWRGPFMRRPKKKQAMFFPVAKAKFLPAIKIKGVPGEWIATRRAIQTPNFPENPWVVNIWFRNASKLEAMLNYLLNQKLKYKTQKKIKGG